MHILNSFRFISIQPGCCLWDNDLPSLSMDSSISCAVYELKIFWCNPLKYYMFIIYEFITSYYHLFVRHYKQTRKLYISHINQPQSAVFVAVWIKERKTILKWQLEKETVKHTRWKTKYKFKFIHMRQTPNKADCNLIIFFDYRRNFQCTDGNMG